MRISDWSSDVCSSDLRLLQRTTRKLAPTETGRAFYERAVAILSAVEDAEAMVAGRSERARGPLKVTAPTSFGRLHIAPHLKRSEERRGGKPWGSTCRSWWSPYE